MPQGCIHSPLPRTRKVELAINLKWFFSRRLCFQAYVIPLMVLNRKGVDILSCTESLLTSSQILSTPSRWGSCNAKPKHSLSCLWGSTGKYSHLLWGQCYSRDSKTYLKNILNMYAMFGQCEESVVMLDILYNA